MPQRRTLTSHVRAGILFDDRTHQVLVSTGSSVGHIQCYDVEKDVGATIIGATQQEVSKTETNEVRGARKIDHMAMSRNGEWLFVVEGNEAISLVIRKRGEKGEWREFCVVATAWRRES